MANEEIQIQIQRIKALIVNQTYSRLEGQKMIADLEASQNPVVEGISIKETTEVVSVPLYGSEIKEVKIDEIPEKKVVDEAKEMADIKAFLDRKGVKYHYATGIKRLRILFEENK